jgi:hypothetical protein
MSRQPEKLILAWCRTLEEIAQRRAELAEQEREAMAAIVRSVQLNRDRMYLFGVGGLAPEKTVIVKECRIVPHGQGWLVCPLVEETRRTPSGKWKWKGGSVYSRPVRYDHTLSWCLTRLDGRVVLSHTDERLVT